ncbi:unnamed protein product [Acanthoscelides obtectus]|uniref:Uncharacterized protein n=1 Tax=Acanthoscelides obtectus TaxID=200917 RepID=A0A9P0JXE4_ACAOB|nr:unnamed protein product [Acanthoscelides obtectus]CAK1623776.1 hypothetical protein AOBTE_LOCUS2174 [Acanthoscelides obtectus]
MSCFIIHFRRLLLCPFHIINRQLNGRVIFIVGHRPHRLKIILRLIFGLIVLMLRPQWTQIKYIALQQPFKSKLAVSRSLTQTS